MTLAPRSRWIALLALLAAGLLTPWLEDQAVAHAMAMTSDATALREALPEPGLRRWDRLRDWVPEGASAGRFIVGEHAGSDGKSPSHTPARRRGALDRAPASGTARLIPST